MKRSEALAGALDYYYTGKQCRNGHLSLRLTKKAQCIECTAIHNAKAKESRKTELISNKAIKPYTRAQALLNGYRLYYTGLICRNGHDSPRFTSGGNCRECSLINSINSRKNKKPKNIYTYKIDKSLDHIAFHSKW